MVFQRIAMFNKIIFFTIWWICDYTVKNIIRCCFKSSFITSLILYPYLLNPSIRFELIPCCFIICFVSSRYAQSGSIDLLVCSTRRFPHTPKRETSSGMSSFFHSCSNFPPYAFLGQAFK